MESNIEVSNRVLITAPTNKEQLLPFLREQSKSWNESFENMVVVHFRTLMRSVPGMRAETFLMAAHRCEYVRKQLDGIAFDVRQSLYDDVTEHARLAEFYINMNVEDPDDEAFQETQRAWHDVQLRLATETLEEVMDAARCVTEPAAEPHAADLLKWREMDEQERKLAIRKWEGTRVRATWHDERARVKSEPEKEPSDIEKFFSTIERATTYAPDSAPAWASDRVDETDVSHVTHKHRFDGEIRSQTVEVRVSKDTPIKGRNQPSPILRELWSDRREVSYDPAIPGTEKTVVYVSSNADGNVTAEQVRRVLEQFKDTPNLEVHCHTPYRGSIDSIDR